MSDLLEEFEAELNKLNSSDQNESNENLIEEKAEKLPEKKRSKISIFFISGIFITLSVFISFQTFWIFRKVSEVNTRQYIALCQQIVQARTGEIANWNNAMVNDLRIFTDAGVVKTGDAEKVKAWLDENRNLANPRFGNTFFAADDGNTFQLGNQASTYIADRDYYRRLMVGSLDSFISEPLYSRALSRTVYMVSKAAKDANGKTFGIFAASVFPDQIKAVISNISVGKNGRAFLLAGDGSVLAHWNDEYVMNVNFLKENFVGTSGLQQIAQNMTDGKEGFDYYKAVDGEKIVIYAPVPETSWSLGIEVPVVQMHEASRSILSIIFILGAVIFICILAFSIFALQRIVTPIKIVEKTIIGISQGDADLTQRININRNDEIGSLVDGFNHFVNKLQQIISNVKKSKNKLTKAEVELKQSVEDTGCSITEILCNIESCSNLVQNQAESVDETAGAVTKIADSINTLEKMIMTQSAGVSEASSAVEQMIGNINSVDVAIGKMSAEFAELQSDAKEGIEKQSNVNETVRTIAAQSAMLQEANEAIASLASQTNMLAMNAAIEAAHAGDAGKGFSVVADEIRKLSETSSEQSRTIGEELNKISNAIELVVVASQDSENTFNNVSARIQQTDQVVQQLRLAMSEQQAGSKQILSALHAMNESTAEVRSASVEMAQGNKTVLDEMQSLQESTQVIKNSMSEMTVGAKMINETGARLHSISREVTDTIKEIGKEIDLFKV